MNWKRVATYVLFLVVVPQVIGFAFGIGAVLFESIFNGPNGAFWARWATIRIAHGVIYARLAFVQPVRCRAHVSSVFAITELLFMLLGRVEIVWPGKLILTGGDFSIPVASLAVRCAVATIGAVIGSRLIRNRSTRSTK